jgi:purine-nucleoside phosphorylase
MNETITISQIDELSAAIAARTTYRPKIGIILGSGLGSLVDAVEQPLSVPYDDLPYWPASTVVGHHGRLVFGRLENYEVVLMQGRAHYYEGYSMARITLPIRALQRFGVETLIVTNAAGAINQAYKPGDLMLIIDHINLIGMAGNNPLRGPNLDEFGPRFPDMSQVYDRKLLSLARDVAAGQNITLHEGVYGLAGLRNTRFTLYARPGQMPLGCQRSCVTVVAMAGYVCWGFQDQQQSQPGWKYFDNTC